MADWQPIETAPKDGTRIDVWMVGVAGDKKPLAFRMTDICWSSVEELEVESTGWFPHGAWTSPSLFRRKTIETPRSHPWRTGAWQELTHWMPLPEPPGVKKSEFEPPTEFLDRERAKWLRDPEGYAKDLEGYAKSVWPDPWWERLWQRLIGRRDRASVGGGATE
jgi:hypothetical protein